LNENLLQQGPGGCKREAPSYNRAVFEGAVSRQGMKKRKGEGAWGEGKDNPCW